MTDVRDALYVAHRSDGTIARRPMSPHLQVYRFQLSMFLSIANRVTGIAASFGTLLLVWWLVAGATGPAAFDTVQRAIGSPVGLLVLFGWTLALVFHTAGGVRHLFWDAGYGFKLPDVRRNGIIVIATTVVLTLLIWGIGLSVWAGAPMAASGAVPAAEAPAPTTTQPAGN
ncbi:succinate dehydrogenase, cytochrome b556 subunit [Rhizosaccharibacter radicis]|uniref:Succinate dehydrogenase cytochrome b556 subunit n=1 Tax=Rhizosaccharibacter radicis TaxID=2782605 RepID=A0ABT1VZW5_9PROT|nr:succinate dehydrogenase, cytochrome b556 subunit [Acetobacteraceae bacterium KSS12]